MRVLVACLIYFAIAGGGGGGGTKDTFIFQVFVGH